MATDDCARILLQGTLRLSSRLRHERPAGALASSKVSVLSYLRRHGPSSPSTVAAAGPGAAPRPTERCVRAPIRGAAISPGWPRGYPGA